MRTCVIVVLLSAARAASELGGVGECKCVDIWQLNVTGANVNASSSTCAFIGSGDGKCFERTYGHGCLAHDADFPGCAGDNPPEWCSKQWCWVDPTTCTRPHNPSEYFSDSWLASSSTTGECGTIAKLSFSYETCGDLNLFRLRYSDFLESYEQRMGRPIRVSFPGNSGSGYTLVTLGENETALYNGTRRAGSFVDFGADVLAAHGANWVEVPIAQKSRLYSPQSSFVRAACALKRPTRSLGAPPPLLVRSPSASLALSS